MEATLELTHERVDYVPLLLGLLIKLQLFLFLDLPSQLSLAVQRGFPRRPRRRATMEDHPRTDPRTRR